jgi:prevent-host-death family protein
MPITTVSSRDLNQDVTRAKKAALNGPVFITDRGRPSHVLLSIDEYKRLTNQGRNIADTLAMYDASGIDFEPDAMAIKAKPVSFD